MTTAIHHLAFRTVDVDGLAAFYERILGLPVVRRDPDRSVWLAIAGGVLMIETAAPGEPPWPAGSLELCAFRVDAVGRDRVRSALATLAVPIEAETAHTTYFRDPDGRRIGASTHPLDGHAGDDGMPSLA